ncbi:MAG: undecaprenyl/decaprenyl-phosphate alpha-N-acetylglucosaminyl 1-phosphate transferase [Firmicutes bacterium]|nr:undecaprenyl/decaprenyl-phosphate alpha-N-acetylglucosaminyl 1-phosphate transferase [Bacillota bacterium]
MTPSHLLLPFLIAFGVTFAVTPLIKRLAPKLGLVDHPNPRRINKVPMPTGGGLAVFAGFALAARYAGVTDVFPTFTAAAVILAVGLVDDRVGLKASWKFLGQLLGVLVYVIWGSRIEFVSNPFGGMFYLSWLAIPVTVFWFLALINLMNFIDGLDGLAVGITLIAALTLMGLAWDLGRFEAAVLSAVLVGVAAGFLPFNFNPAKLFLGDSGAMLFGFLLALISTEGALKGAATIGLSVPILIFALPIVDTVCAIVRRTQNGVPFYQADQDHFHHRMLKLGLSQRQVVFVAYLLSSVSACAALFTARHTWAAFVLVPLVGAGFLYGSARVGMIQIPSSKFKYERRL